MISPIQDWTTALVCGRAEQNRTGACGLVGRRLHGLGYHSVMDRYVKSQLPAAAVTTPSGQHVLPPVMLEFLGMGPGRDFLQKGPSRSSISTKHFHQLRHSRACGNTVFITCFIATYTEYRS